MKSHFVIAALALFPTFAPGGELRLQCPERYLSRVAELTEVPREWPGAIAQVSPGLLISGGGMIGASPKLYPPADLRGSEVRTKGGWSETRYPVAGESWIYCAYGQGGEIQLFRRVDGTGVRECAVRTLRPRAPASPVVEIVCK
jgi:hypothetical protein